MKNILLFTLLLVSSSLFCQSYLFPGEESGLGLQGQIANQDGNRIMELNTSYTLKGKTDFSFGIGHESSDSNEGYGIFLKPGVSYLALKQGQNPIPASLRLYTSYSYYYFDDPEWNAGQLKMGGSLHHEITISDDFQLIPGFLGEWIKSDLWKNGNKEASDRTHIFGLLATIVYKDIYIEPTYLFKSDYNIFFLKFGIIIPN